MNEVIPGGVPGGTRRDRDDPLPGQGGPPVAHGSAAAPGHGVALGRGLDAEGAEHGTPTIYDVARAAGVSIA